MRHLPLLSATLLLGPLALGALVVDADARAGRAADEAAIRRTIQYYFDGAPTVRKAFHPTAQMTFMADSGFALVPIEEYIARVEKSGKERPADARPDGVEKRIATIDVTGDAAVAKLELKRPTSLITDYMTLLRIDGEWKIVNKSFTRNTTP